MTFRLRYAAISDVGRVRKDNQDSGYVGPWMLAVCDGVGGAARGDLASATAIGQLRKLDTQPSDDMVSNLVAARTAGGEGLDDRTVLGEVDRCDVKFTAEPVVAPRMESDHIAAFGADCQ